MPWLCARLVSRVYRRRSLWTAGSGYGYRLTLALKKKNYLNWRPGLSLSSAISCEWTKPLKAHDRPFEQFLKCVMHARFLKDLTGFHPSCWSSDPRAAYLSAKKQAIASLAHPVVCYVALFALFREFKRYNCCISLLVILCSQGNSPKRLKIVNKCHAPTNCSLRVKARESLTLKNDD